MKEFEKVLDDVSEVTAERVHTVIIKIDGSLWASGDNEYGQIGDGTKEDKLSFEKIMDDVRVLNKGKMQQYGNIEALQHGSENTDEYIYDILDLSENISLPTNMLGRVTDISSAIEATKATVQGMTLFQILSFFPSPLCQIVPIHYYQSSIGYYLSL